MALMDSFLKEGKITQEIGLYDGPEVSPLLEKVLKVLRGEVKILRREVKFRKVSKSNEIVIKFLD